MWTTTRSIDVRTPTTTIAASQPKTTISLEFTSHFPMCRGKIKTGEKRRRKKNEVENRRQCWRIKICTHQPPVHQSTSISICSWENAHTSYETCSINGAHIIRPKIIFSISLCAIPPNLVHLWRRQRSVRRTLIVIIIILLVLCGCVCAFNYSTHTHTHTSQHCQPFLCQQTSNI